jgi:hypothetical protein
MLLIAASIFANHSTINNCDVSINRRVCSWVVVILHDLFYTLVIGGILYALCFIKQRHTVYVILALNFLIATSIVLFLSLKICVLTLWFNKLLGLHRYTLYTYAPTTFFGNIDRTIDETGSKNYILWTKSYLVVIAVLLIMNCFTIKSYKALGV